MADKLPGISLSESDFISMLQGFISKGDIKKKVDVEVNGGKDIEKLTSNFEKLNSIKTDKLTSQLNEITTLLSKRFSKVNLNQFTSQLIQAFQDPTKSAEELSTVIDDVHTSLTTLASISNSGSFVGFNESEIRKAIQKQQKVLELQKQFESEYSNAKTKKQKPVDIITRAKVEKIQKQSSSDVAASLGVDSSKINVKNGDDTLLQTYQQTADLLAKMVSEKKEYNKLNKANVGDYLKQEQDILSVFQQLQDIEKQISEKFGISSKDFLSNQFKSDNGEFDFVKNAEQAVKAYVAQMTSGTKKALEEAKTTLAEQLESAADKSVTRLGDANEKVSRTSGRLGSSKVGFGGETTVQPGAEIGESVAAGMEKAEAATESTTKNIQNYILSLEESIGAIQKLYDEIARLDKEMDSPNITDKRYHELEKEIDSKYLEIAKHRQNVHRLGKSDSFINSKLNTEYDIEDIGTYVNPQIDKNKKIKEELDSIRKYVVSEPVEASIEIITPEETQQLEETKSSLQIILDYLNQLNTQSLKGLVDDFNKLPEPIKAAADELGLLNKEKNGFNVSNNGGENHGVIVGDNTLKSITGTEQKYEDALKLKVALDQAAEAGVNVSRILDVVFDSEKNTILELQKTVPGQVISNIGFGDSTDNLSFNEALLQATDEQIIKLITDIEKLNDLGIDVDFNDSNFLYDKEKGFSIVDLKMKGANSSDFGSNELLEMFSYIKDEFDYAGKDTSAIDAFIERIKTAIQLKDELQKPGGNTELLNVTESEEKLSTIKTEIASLREELQRFKDTGVEPEGISELQSKLESAEQHVRSLSDELSLVYEHSVSESDYSRLEEELALAKANAEDLRESLVQVKSELEQTKVQVPLDSDASAESVSSSQQSAQSDLQAAEAAEQRAQANEHLAESEKQVDVAESANTGTSDTVEQVDTNATEPAIDAEISKLDELKNKIATEIPSAIETKNSAFREEQGIVDGVVSAEIGKLDELKQKIDDVTNATKEKNREFADGQNSDQSNSNKKDKAKKKSQNKTSNTSSQNKTDEDYTNEGIGKYKELIKDVDKFAKLKAKAADPKETMTGGEIIKLEEFNNKLKEANQLAEQYGAKSEELTSIQQRFNEVFNVSNQHFQANTKSAKEAAKEQEKAAKQAAEAARKEQEKARKEAEKIQREQATALKNTEKLYANISDGDKTRFEDQFNAVQSAYKRVIGSKGDLNEYQEFIYSLKELQKYSKIGPGEILPKESFSFDEAKAQAEQIVNSYKNVTKGLSGSTQVDDKGLAHWSATVKDAQGNVQQLQFTWNAATNQMAQQARQLPKETVGIGAAIDGVKKKVKELATYWTARLFDPYQLIGGVKQVINIVREYDDALTEMRKVSDESLSTLKQFQQQSFGIADALGTTGKQIQNSTADWLRLGESFDEAKKSAEVSNLLLNVSEFTSIDDATQSLVSASQAYKDLDKIEIVDKLNNIGNNFSVSTDQLAQGLQNAAAVLHTQGNDIDQALALLTAGNAITQDISKTSAGVRTISLRIAGTEEAKNEVADLGEDIDDFVVRTRSKTDQIIRDYTAVASNNYKGVSVLDDNGNLRDTYDILLDIASVYKEIQQEDKQRGTNRANALVETLAGKNRSNIAASILENPELLKDVYEASQQSAGSALEENEKHLDSISGKMQQMQNHLQEIANIVADSDGLKIILDFVNEILSGVTDIVDVFGGLPGIFGAVGGILMQKNGFDLFNFKNIKEWKSGFSKLFKNIFTHIEFPNEAISNIFDQMDPQKSYSTQLEKLQEEGTIIPQEMLDIKEQVNTARDAMDKLGETTGGLSGLFSNLKGVAINALSSIASAGLGMLAMWAAGEVFKVIYELWHADEIAIEKGKEATQSIEERYKAYEDLKDVMAETEKSVTGEDTASDTTEESIENIAKRYDELHDGVNELNNANKSLSSDEYQEYLDLCNQLAEQSPELVTGWDAQGNAILNLGNTAAEAEAALMRMYEAEKLAANVEIGQDIQDSYYGFYVQIKNKNKENEKLQDEIDELNANIGDGTPKEIPNYGGTSHVENDLLTISQYSLDADKALTSALEKYGLSKGSTIGDYFSGTPFTFKISGLEKLNKNQIADIQSQVDEAVAYSYNKQNNRDISEKNEKLSQKAANELYIKDQTKSIQGIISRYLTTSDVFTEQSDAIQNAILANLDSLDLSVIQDKYAGDIVPYIYGELITPINELKPEAQEAISGLFELDSSKISADDYLRQFRTVLQGQFGHGEEYENWAGIFGFTDIEDEVSQAQDDIINGINDASKSGEEVNYEALFGLSLDDLRIYAEIIRGGFKGTWEQLESEVEKYKANIAPDSTDTLATLLNDESYKESADQFSSNLSSLTGALETLRTEGQLTAEEMVNLQNSFPDLTEFTTESIQTKAFEELDEWIGKIRDGMKDMSDEGKEQARTMIQNMVDQYGDLGLSYQDVKNAYWDEKGHSEMKGRIGLFDAQVEQLRSRLASEGTELDTHVLYTLVASDQFSGTADEIYDKYKDVEFEWKITLENQDLERRIQQQQSVINREASSRSLKEARGEILAPEDYETSTASAKAIARMRKKEMENAKTTRDTIDDHKSSEYAAANQKYIEAEQAYIDAQTDAMQIEKEGIESSTNLLQSQIKTQDNTVTQAQNAIAEAEAKYGEGMADASLYEALSDALIKRAGYQTDLSALWETLAKNHSEYFDEFMANSLSAASSAQSDTESAKGYNNIDSQQELNDLQEKATKIQRNLTIAEQNHQKVSKSTYNALIHNAKEQIKLLKQEQKANEDNISKWREYQDQIDSLSDSIYEWSATSESLVYDQAAQLAQTISTAMSESFSETGLTDDTINALKTAFSDLDGSRFDVSDAFYSTADGVKINTEALQELTEAEFELIGSPLADEIANIQEQLERDPGNSALQDKLDSLMETNAKYFAQYEEMQKALSRNAAIDLAEGTSNAGANYDENYGRVKTYKEAYDKGLTGTDDFKAWTSYLDVYGRDTLEAYEDVSGKIERYFTEDAADGLGNFLTDMEKLGYAAQDADGYWTITADDYDAAAKDMQMGSEWFMDTMNKLEDFGFIHTYVSSLNEAQLKTRDVEEQIADAVQTYSDMVARGASDEDLQKQIEHINELESQWQDLDTVTKTWGETTEANRRKEFLGLDDQLSAFEEMYKNADTDAGRDAARKAAEDYVKQFGYTLEEGKFKLSADDLVDYESRITTFSGSMENPLTAQEMGISAENVEKFDGAIDNVKQLAESGDLSSIQKAISGLTAEDLKSIDYSDGKYTEGFEAAEGAVDQLRDSLGLAKEDTDLLIDVMTALGLVEGQTVDTLPSKMQDLQDFLATATKSSGAGYQISTDISRMSADQLKTQMSEIEQLEADINVEMDPDSDVYKQLEELKKQTEIQLNIKNSDQTQTQLKEWAEAGDRENIAKTFGIDVNSEEVDKYIEQINNMPSDYDLAIHIDDSQFQTLIESITGKPYQAEVEVVGKDKLTQFVNKIRTKLQNNPITQPIVQKVQQFGQKVKEQVTATVKTGDSDKKVGKIENSVEDLNKTTGTAKVNVNTKGALSNIQNVRNQLLSLNSVVATPRINVITGNATSIISQIRDSINQLRDKTVTLTTKKVTTGALGTAHSLGTTALSRAHANGTQDWTVGQDESALVNEIGQESIVRDGVWQLIPGGPHVEDLRRDDIVFNAQQTADLIRTGKTARRGQLVAHANGTVPGMSAYVTTGKNKGPGLKRSGGSGGGKKSGGGKGNSGGNKGSKNNKSSKSTDKKLDAFNKYIEKLFDWIEVRLDRIQRRIDNATQQAENAIGTLNQIGSISKNKNAYVNTAMSETRSLISNNQAGEQRYYKQANEVYKKATSGKTKILDAKTAQNIIKKIKDGTIDINSYNERTRTFIKDYQTW